MVLPIYNAFHPVLKQKTSEVKNIDENIIQLVNDMYETMDFAEGIGLAANQVGRSISIVTVNDIYDDEDRLIHPKKAYINPVITSFSDETEDFNEGCLSVPELRETVTRPKEIQVQYVDINGNERSESVQGLLARVLQHEIDHLNGILFFERISPIRRTLIQNKLKKIKKGLIVPNYPMVLPSGKLIGELTET